MSVSGEDDESTELYDLANSILDECKQAAPLGDLETAILLFREALDRRPDFHPLHSDSRSNLAGALLIRFSYTNQRQDLGEALMMLCEMMCHWADTANIQHIAEGRLQVDVSLGGYNNYYLFSNIFTGR